MDTHTKQPRNGKIVPVSKSGRSPECERMAMAGKKLKYKGKGMTWEAICIRLRILKKNGDPNPGMAKRIVDEGYEPKLLETRLRLGFRPLCPACGHRVRFVRQVPEWVRLGANLLALREAATNPYPDPVRVYGRNGKRAILGDGT